MPETKIYSICDKCRDRFPLIYLLKYDHKCYKCFYIDKDKCYIL